ncbi:MAG: hypothetical protein ACFE0S_01795 [Rhodospirillales bacterium]
MALAFFIAGAATASATAPIPLEPEPNLTPGRAMGHLSPDEIVGPIENEAPSDRKLHEFFAVSSAGAVFVCAVEPSLAGFTGFGFFTASENCLKDIQCLFHFEWKRFSIARNK